MKKIILFLINLAILAALCGCASIKSLQNSLGYGIFKDYPYEYSEKDESKRAKSIKEAILGIDGISDAGVVITGKTVLIGLSLDTKDRDETAKLKSEAARLAHQTDRSILNTSVTANESIVEMIKNMEEGKLSFTLLPALTRS